MFGVAGHPDVVTVMASTMLKLHTTRSWDFMDMERDGQILPDSIWKHGRFGQDVIIANLDSGTHRYLYLFIYFLNNRIKLSTFASNKLQSPITKFSQREQIHRLIAILILMRFWVPRAPMVDY
jgi:hypothetical protein